MNLQKDEKFMRRALSLAARSGRAVAPNPMVGAVIVKNGKVIGQGWHERFGGPHAEVLALGSLKNPSDAVGATMYVTLEPCRHTGKTPPCWDSIVPYGFARVVVGSRDPFQRKFRTPKSSVRVDYLKGVVADECTALNKFFFTWVTKKRPFLTVKIATSADGFVAGVDGQPVHFTSPAQDRQVHALRASHQSILVGVGTVLSDDPRLTVRDVKGKDPLRVIVDSQLRTPRTARVLADDNYLIATCKKRIPRELNAWVSPTQKRVSLKKLLSYLATQGISSVLVEPGPTLYQSLKKQGLIDELIVLKGKKKLGSGLKIEF